MYKLWIYFLCFWSKYRFHRSVRKFFRLYGRNDLDDKTKRELLMNGFGYPFKQNHDSDNQDV